MDPKSMTALKQPLETSKFPFAGTLFSGESRDAFRSALPLDSGTWSRGRDWALWKAMITLPNIGAIPWKQQMPGACLTQ